MISQKTEWLESRTQDHLPLTAVGSNPVMGVRIFQVRKPPSWLAEGRWFYPGVDLGLISLKRLIIHRITPGVFLHL